MAILLPLQMALVMLQCWPAHATMYHTMTYSDSACTMQLEDQWDTAEVCSPHSPSGGYLKWTCNGANAEARVYSDAACTTVNTTYNSAPHVVNGEFVSNGACFNQTTSYAKYLCFMQPAQMTFNRFTDASCTQATHSEGPQAKMALDVCMYEMNDGVLEAEKITGSASTSLSKNTYTTNDCSGTGTAAMTWPLADASTCHMVESGHYMKYVSVATAAEAAAAISSSSSGNSGNSSGNSSGNTTAAPKATASGSVSTPASVMAMLMLVKTVL